MTDSTNDAENKRNRQRQMTVAAAVFLAVGLVWLAYWTLVARFYEETNDAYVSGNIVQVTPQISGTVIAIHADDTDSVKAGDTLIQLDDSDARIALDEAKASLAQTVREVRSLFNSNDTLRARISLQEAALAKAQSDLGRRKGLDTSGAVSSEEIHHSETAVQAASADLLAANEDLAGNLALTEDTSVREHPRVVVAGARVKAAYLDLQRTRILASVDGVVTKRSVQLGQKVAPGTPLMAVISMEDLWVDANFKESQLGRVRIGQPVELTADIYGGGVTYQGTVLGIEPGTGSAFSLLPPQNATGNWIKVVQRVPVRIGLNPNEIAEHPLRIGLSMVATVDISDDSGEVIAPDSSQDTSYQTQVFDNSGQHAEVLVDQIIDANMGKPQTPVVQLP